MMTCGDDADAEVETEDLLVEQGWPGATDAGDVESARYREALVPLWVRVGSVLAAWNRAFTAVR